MESSSQRLILFATIGILAVVFSLSNHSIHSMLWRCQGRTDTSRQTIFELRRPHPVTYDFSTLSPDIMITVPPYSHWRSDDSFHYTAAACARLFVIEGHWVIFMQNGGTVECHDGFAYNQRPLSYMTWFKNRPEAAEAKLRLTANAQFYRTVSSAIQDAELYFSLCTTPLWLRSTYFGTHLAPFRGRIREWMVNTTLWIQLRVIYYKNDFWTYEGELRLDRIFVWPPDWAERLQYQSMYFISRMVVRSSSWLGRIALGMKDSYEEYDIEEDQPRKNSERAREIEIGTSDSG